MSGLSPSWVAAVRAACEPVFTAAHAGFVANDTGGDALLWEADPEMFLRRYPDSGIDDSYGDTWPPPCLDFWVYVDAHKREARLSIEGWNEEDIVLVLSMNGQHDGRLIAEHFARVLRVVLPDTSTG